MSNKTIKSLPCFLTTIFVLLVSCKQETKKIQEKKTTDSNIEFNFPDTVYVGKYYNGKIFYKNIFDTATTKLLDIKKLRIIKYSFSVTKNLNYDIENLKKSITDTFIADNNRMIPLYNISFNNPGVRYIDGVITDEINIDGITLLEGKMQPSTRIITHEFRATHKVIVIKDRTQKVIFDHVDNEQ